MHECCPHHLRMGDKRRTETEDDRTAACPEDYVLLLLYMKCRCLHIVILKKIRLPILITFDNIFICNNYHALVFNNSSYNFIYMIDNDVMKFSVLIMYTCVLAYSVVF